MKRFSLLWMVILFLLAGCNAPVAPAAQSVAPLSTPTPGAVQPAATLPGEPMVAETPLPPGPTATSQLAQPDVAAPQAGAWISYLGMDGNIWMLDPASGSLKQLTQDGTPFGAVIENAEEVIQYNQLRWSSDGQLLAFERQRGEKVTGGFAYHFSVWIYDAASGEIRPLLENQQVLGFQWKPNTHLVAYSYLSDRNYFARGEPNREVAKGIWMIDADTLAVSELVKPERGYHLRNPRWSPDGQTVSFEELLYVEGRGAFSYYDLATHKYFSWERPIGNYQWLADNQGLVYDTLIYVPSGEERIYLNHRDNTAEKQLSPDVANGYASGVVLSPQGDQVAYVQTSLHENGTLTERVMVQSLPEGEPRAFGSFESPADLAWSADGQSLLLAAGPYYEGRQLVMISMADGSTQVLMQGMFPSWQPVP